MGSENNKPKTIFQDRQAMNNLMLAMGNLYADQANDSNTESTNQQQKATNNSPTTDAAAQANNSENIEANNFNTEGIPNQQQKAANNSPTTDAAAQANNLGNMEVKLFQLQLIKRINNKLQSKLSADVMVSLYGIILGEDNINPESLDSSLSSLFEVTEDGNIKQTDTNPFYNSKWSVWDKLYFFLVQSDEPLRVADLVEKILVQENIDTDNAELVRKINVNVNATLSSKFLNGDNIINRQKIKNEYHYSLADKDIIATRNV